MKKKPEKQNSKTSPKAGSSSGTPETSSALASSIYQVALADIRDEINGLHNKTKKPPKRYDRVDRIAYLAKQASVFAAEDRKERAAALSNAKRLSPGQVEVWLRDQTPEYLENLIRELQDFLFGEKASVIG